MGCSYLEALQPDWIIDDIAELKGLLGGGGCLMGLLAWKYLCYLAAHNVVKFFQNTFQV